MEPAAQTSNGSPQPAHWGFWGTILWGAVVGAVFLGAQLLALFVIVAVRNSGGVSGSDPQLLASAIRDGTVIAAAALVSAVVCCTVIAGIIKLKRHSTLKDSLALHTLAPGTMLKWLGLLAAFVVLSDTTTTLLGRPLVPSFMSSAYATADPIWLLWVALIAAAPLLEETFFRGFLFKGFESSFMGPVGAVLVTAALWAMIHVQYDALDILTVFILGLLLGAARTYTGSLLAPFVMHSAANLVATIEAAVMAGPA